MSRAALNFPFSARGAPPAIIPARNSCQVPRSVRRGIAKKELGIEKEMRTCTHIRVCRRSNLLSAFFLLSASLSPLSTRSGRAAPASSESMHMSLRAHTYIHVCVCRRAGERAGCAIASESVSLGQQVYMCVCAAAHFANSRQSLPFAPRVFARAGIFCCYRPQDSFSPRRTRFNKIYMGDRTRTRLLCLFFYFYALLHAPNEIYVCTRHSFFSIL